MYANENILIHKAKIYANFTNFFYNIIFFHEFIENLLKKSYNSKQVLNFSIQRGKIMFQNLRIKERLTKSFRVIALTSAIAAVLGVIMLLITLSQYKNALTNYGFSQGDIGKAMVCFADTRSAARGIIGYNEQDLIDNMQTVHDEKKEKFTNYWKTVADTVTKSSEKKYYNAVNDLLTQYWDAEQQTLDIGATTDNEASIKAQTMMGDTVDPLYDEIYSNLAKLMDANVTEGNRLASVLSVVGFLFIAIIIAIIILCLVTSTRMGAKIATGIADPLIALEARLKTFAVGNLHDPFPVVDTNDEVSSMIDTANQMAERLNEVIADCGLMMENMANGNYAICSQHVDKYSGDFEKLLLSMRSMRDAMVETIRTISEASAQVTAGASNLSQSSQSMAEGATEQAGAAEQLQATITDITSNIDHAATQAEEAYEQAHAYADEARTSSEEMKVMVDAMARIDDTSQKIGNIISEIEEIASQTNLLSLNASIEAARAGEAGRGFAVVADQIRQLAEQTSKSAVDTRELIEGALQEVSEGNQAAEKVSASLNHVVDGIEQIAQSSKAISTVSRDQADAMNQAEQGVNQISEVIQSNSAAAQESSATSEELSAEATSLDDLVGRYVLPEQ